MALSFPDASFDIVWSVEAGPHMPDKAVFARELLRVLKPGGLLVVCGLESKGRSPQAPELLGEARSCGSSWTSGRIQLSRASRASPSCWRQQGLSKEAWRRQTGPGRRCRPGWRRYGRGSSGPKGWCASAFVGLIKSMREVPTFLLMRLAFGRGLCRYGMFRARRAGARASGVPV